MRIGFFVWEYPPRLVGGLGTYAADICPAILDLGHDISVFTLNDGALKTREILKGIDVNRPMLVDGSNILPIFVAEDLKRWGTGIRFFSDVLIYNILHQKSEDIAALRARYDIAPDEKMILFIGRLTSVKGIVNLVKAVPSIISKHPEAKLVILGRGELERTITDLISRLGIEDHVKTRFEFVSEEERIVHYGSCDIFTAPSVYEPFGIVALEAMSMEKPVVVGARGISGFRDFVIPSGHDQTGIHVDGSNSADIAWGITTLLDDMAKAKEMGRRGRMRVLKYFTWDKIAGYTVSTYEEVVKEVNKGI